MILSRMIRIQRASRNLIHILRLDKTECNSIKPFKYKQKNDEHENQSKGKYGWIPMLFSSVVLTKSNDDEHEKEMKKTKQKEGFLFLADTIEKVMPSVVHIEVQGEHRSSMLNGEFQGSKGSGFIVSDDGLIITNAHVIGSLKNRQIVVKLSDKRSFNAKVLKFDVYTDLAVLKIDASNLRPVKFGDSTKVRTGEFVTALGSPLGLENAASSGIVSNSSKKSRDLGLPSDISYIQTDAMITKGNSGGPLINLDGEVIGIATLGIPGINFSIASKYALDLLNSKEELLKPNILGLDLITLDEDYYHREKLDSIRQIMLPPEFVQGCLIYNVKKNSPAEHSHLKPWDIIVKVNNIPVANPIDFYKIVKEAESDLHLTVLKDAIYLVDVYIKPEEK